MELYADEDNYFTEFKKFLISICCIYLLIMKCKQLYCIENVLNSEHGTSLLTFKTYRIINQKMLIL